MLHKKRQFIYCFENEIISSQPCKRSIYIAGQQAREFDETLPRTTTVDSCIGNGKQRRLEVGFAATGFVGLILIYCMKMTQISWQLLAR